MEARPNAANVRIVFVFMTNHIIDKISQYNFFNYLYPGILFFLFAPELYGVNLLDFFRDNIVASLFLAYLIGSILSRIGSLAVEPILKKFKFVKFADYSDFLVASRKDSKLNILSQENNTYRTLIALFVSLTLLHLLEDLLFHYLDSELTFFIFIILLALLFMFSYRKHTKYIKKRVEKQS